MPRWLIAVALPMGTTFPRVGVVSTEAPSWALALMTTSAAMSNIAMTKLINILSFTQAERFTFQEPPSVFPSRYHYQTTRFEKGESLSLGFNISPFKCYNQKT